MTESIQKLSEELAEYSAKQESINQAILRERAIKE